MSKVYPLELEQQPSTTSYDLRMCMLICICGILLLPLIFGIMVVTLSLIFYTNDPKFYVDNVTLAQFTITNDTLYYNLAVNMTFRNPSPRVGSNYHKIEAYMSYLGYRFATKEIQGFYLGHKSENSIVNTVFKGEQQGVLKDLDDKLRYHQEHELDIYAIVLHLDFKMKHKFFLEETNNYKYKVRCYLGVPLISSSSAKFERTECNFDMEYSCI